jgi:streptogrisin C
MRSRQAQHKIAGYHKVAANPRSPPRAALAPPRLGSITGMIATLFACLALLAAAPMSAQQALSADARSLAADRGLPQAEAERRLRIQMAAGSTVGRLRREYGARLAGLFYEHDPEYRLVVRLTGDAPVADRLVRLGGSQLPIVFRTGASATLAELLAAMQAHGEEIKAALPGLTGMGPDERTGEIVLHVYARGPQADVARAQAASLSAAIGQPVRIEIVDAPVSLQ